MTPTQQQINILKEAGPCVVIASPGSGKTYVMSEHIRNILHELPGYKGVIAISFTNKASRELKERALHNGYDGKASWFGTIDSFCFSEIIAPFGKHFFGIPIKELSIIDKSSLVSGENDTVFDILNLPDKTKLLEEQFQSLGTLFHNGQVLLELLGVFALAIIRRSKACRRYLTARYTNIFVDEYQDSDAIQHEIFLALNNIGLSGMAVGDIDQSIFKWAKKSPQYIQDLAKNGNFNVYPMDKNHRCHASIINYSTQLLAKHSNLLPAKEIRVFEKQISGTEKDIGKWLSAAIPQFEKHFSIKRRNNIAILVRSRRTANHVSENLSLPYRFVDATPIDSMISIWASIFRRILYYLANPEDTRYELFEELGIFDIPNRNVSIIKKCLIDAKECFIKGHYAKTDNYFCKIAEILYPNASNIDVINALKVVLNNETLVRTFYPPNTDEVEITTFHKAKGLEFDIVFHLDLYEYIFPMYNGDYTEDLNLHYVGITRAKEATVLCHSTQRHKANDTIVNANPSPFLELNNVNRLRSISIY